MTDRTPRIGVPIIRAGQGNQGTLYNEAIQRIETAGTLTFIDFALDTPPGSPGTGDTYLVGSSPTGDWASHANEIAYYDNGWLFIDPADGGRWVAYVVDDKEWIAYDPVEADWYPIIKRDSDPGADVAAEHFIGFYRGASKRYAKTIDFGALPNATTKPVAHGITGLDLNYLRAPVVMLTVSNGTLVLSQPSRIAGIVTCSIGSTSVIISSVSDESAYSGFIRIEYCKT